MPPLHPKAQAYLDGHRAHAERELERAKAQMLATIAPHDLPPHQVRMVLADLERAHARRLQAIHRQARRTPV